MTYPLIRAEMDQGPSLLIPDPAQIKTIYETLLASDPTTPFPYWARLWPSGQAMADFLRWEPTWVKGGKVLEIGAGIGLPSFTIAALAREVTLSDHSPEAIELAEKNIEHLGLKNVKARCLDWNHFPDDLDCDTVIMSDVNYSPDQFENLAALIKRFMEKGCDMILATPQRITATMFVPAIQPYIKRSMQRTINDQGQDVDISILVLAS